MTTKNMKDHFVATKKKKHGFISLFSGFSSVYNKPQIFETGIPKIYQYIFIREKRCSVFSSNWYFVCGSFFVWLVGRAGEVGNVISPDRLQTNMKALLFAFSMLPMPFFHIHTSFLVFWLFFQKKKIYYNNIFHSWQKRRKKRFIVSSSFSSWLILLCVLHYSSYFFSQRSLGALQTFIMYVDVGMCVCV